METNYLEETDRGWEKGQAVEGNKDGRTFQVETSWWKHGGSGFILGFPIWKRLFAPSFLPHSLPPIAGSAPTSILGGRNFPSPAVGVVAGRHSHSFFPPCSALQEQGPSPGDIPGSDIWAGAGDMFPITALPSLWSSRHDYYQHSLPHCEHDIQTLAEQGKLCLLELEKNEQAGRWRTGRREQARKATGGAGLTLVVVAFQFGVEWRGRQTLGRVTFPRPQGENLLPTPSPPPQETEPSYHMLPTCNSK